jgi:hypothetical protein
MFIKFNSLALAFVLVRNLAANNAEHKSVEWNVLPITQLVQWGIGPSIVKNIEYRSLDNFVDVIIVEPAKTLFGEVSQNIVKIEHVLLRHLRKFLLTFIKSFPCAAGVAVHLDSSWLFEQNRTSTLPCSFPYTLLTNYRPPTEAFFAAAREIFFIVLS